MNVRTTVLGKWYCASATRRHILEDGILQKCHLEGFMFRALLASVDGHSSSQLTSRSTSQLISQSVNQPVNQSVNQ